MTKAKQNELCKRLDRQLIAIISPKDMTYEEYCNNCNLNGFRPSVLDGMFLHWLMTADGCYEQVEQVQKKILNALEKKYLLDLDDTEQ
jgi:hypothetical protein